MPAKRMPNQHAGRDFMEFTRYKYAVRSDQQKGMPQPPLQAAYSGEPIALPPPDKIQVQAIDLRAAIEGRQSVRRYAESALTLDELSFLLWCTQGIKGTKGSYATLRTVPSAGARHAFETFLLINRVEGLAPGLYRFLALGHQLVEMNLDEAIGEAVTQACWNQRFVLGSAVTFIWVAVPYRMTWRYGQRGYRYMHLEAGHVCQNLYLSAEAIGCGVCAIAAFSDEDMNRLLELDRGTKQVDSSPPEGEPFVIYVATVGKKPAQ
jgi:SagB-type dehydrogenase family enzyme